MKAPSNRWISRFLPLALLTGALAVPSQASTIYTLNDANSTAVVDVGSQSGMKSWTVDNIGQLYQQWFWFRVGPNSREFSIDTIGTPVSTLTGGRFLTSVYTAPNFTLTLDYTLAGGTAGSGRATITENIRILNTSGAPLDFHFFQYSDFDLQGSSGGDEVGLSKNLQGKFNEALQTKGSLSLSEVLENTGLVLGADHGEAALWNTTLAKLNDALPTTLSDALGAGPGNVTWAFQWDKMIDVGGTLEISKTKFLQVPEPSALALMGLGMVALVLRKRR